MNNTVSISHKKNREGAVRKNKFGWLQIEDSYLCNKFNYLFI